MKIITLPLIHFLTLTLTDTIEKLKLNYDSIIEAEEVIKKKLTLDKIDLMKLDEDNNILIAKHERYIKGDGWDCS
jgi:uncharacterized protein (DUF608 family)